jgi:hypothetical protein
MPDRLAPPLLLDVTPTVGLKGGRRIENVKRGTKCPHLEKPTFPMQFEKFSGSQLARKSITLLIFH